MGKKKSVALMILLTVVIVVLCAITAFPVFAVPGTVEKWNPAVMQFDLSAEFDGSYYAYYYPEGVISQADYQNNLSVLEGTEKENYEEEYAQIVKGSNLYFSTLRFDLDQDSNLIEVDNENGGIFATKFEKAVTELNRRFEQKGYSNYRVSVVETYAVRVELPLSQQAEKAGSAFGTFANFGDLTMEIGGTTIDPLTEEGASVKDLVRKFTIGTKYKTSYICAHFTQKGREFIESKKSELSASSDSGEDVKTLDFKIGDEVVLKAYNDNFNDYGEMRVMYVDQANTDYLQTVLIALNSAMEVGDLGIGFETSTVRIAEPLYGKNTLTLLFIAVLVVIVLLIALSVWKMGRFGVVSVYATLSYLIITLLCFAFITKAILEVTLGTVLVFLLGLVLVNGLQYGLYKAIADEFKSGKTVESSVKGGYKKTLLKMVDLYAVLVLVALSLLIGVGGVNTMGVQMLIAMVTGAFINLLWARVINFIFLSASKNKYKYFRFVREDDEDDE